MIFKSYFSFEAHYLFDLNEQNIHLQKAVFITHFHICKFNHFYYFCSTKHMAYYAAFPGEESHRLEGRRVKISCVSRALFIAISQDLIYTKWQRRLCRFWTERPLLWKISTGIFFFFHGWRSFPHLNMKVWQVFPTYNLYNQACYLLISSRVITIKKLKEFPGGCNKFQHDPKALAIATRGKKKAKWEFLSRVLHFWEKGKCYWHYITRIWKTSQCQRRPDGRPGHVQSAKSGPVWEPGDRVLWSILPHTCVTLSHPASLDLDFLPWLWREDYRLQNSIPVLKFYFYQPIKIFEENFAKHTWKPEHYSLSLLRGK